MFANVCDYVNSIFKGGFLKSTLKNLIHKFRYGFVAMFAASFILIIDLTTKAVTEGQHIGIVDGFISIFSSHNTGAAWSMLNKHTWLLVVLSIIFICIILFTNYKFKQKNMMYSIGFGLVIGGAIGNLIDRVAFGYVRDFISLDFINFPIFNIADCAITIGVVLLGLFFVMLTAKDIKNKREQSENLETKEEGTLPKNNNEDING